MQPLILLFLVPSLLCKAVQNSESDDGRETPASRTRWKFRSPEIGKGPNFPPLGRNVTSTPEIEPFFPPVRSQRRKPGRGFYEASSLPVKMLSDLANFDTVEVNGHSGGEEEVDILESDEDLAAEVQQLNDTVTLLMSQRRPSSGPDGALNLVPTPNFALIPDIGPLRQLFQWGSKSIGSYAVCHSCRVGLGYLLLQARTKATLTDLSSKAIFICKFFNVANEEVCTGLVNRFGPTMFFILTTRLEISATMFCGIVLQPLGCTAATYLNEWNVDLSSPFEGIANTRQRIAVKPPSNLIIFDEDSRTHKPMKMLHLTDIHLDLEYRAGANALCDTELCCRASDGEGKDEEGAGFYGDYRKCDLPLASLENALEHMSTQHPDVELIYMTGDLVAHNVWSTGAKENGEVIRVASDLIRKYFPTTRVIPVLGNHDVHPLNLFSPPGIPEEVSTDYIYTLALREWRDWIPRETYHTFLHGGFYTVEVHRHFRVIVLNTNVCYTLNFWQVYEHRDPGGQLRWLVKELHVAESVGAKVHILGHLSPSLDDCWSTWSRNFYMIINRFKSTVTAQFYGHTHYDEFQLLYDQEDKSTPISPIWIGASLTPFVNLNPAYKIFTIDLPSLNVIDHETWIYDLDLANQNPLVSPQWFRLYRATDAYHIPDVLPSSLNEFVYRMSSDAEAFKVYYKNYHHASQIALKEECDMACRKRILCRIVTPHYSEQKECIQVQTEVDGIILPKRIFQNKTSTAVGSQVFNRKSRWH